MIHKGWPINHIKSWWQNIQFYLIPLIPTTSKALNSVGVIIKRYSIFSNFHGQLGPLMTMILSQGSGAWLTAVKVQQDDWQVVCTDHEQLNSLNLKIFWLAKVTYCLYSLKPKETFSHILLYKHNHAHDLSCKLLHFMFDVHKYNPNSASALDKPSFKANLWHLTQLLQCECVSNVNNLIKVP